MKVTVFAKKRESSDGRKFTTYIAKLHKKDGSEVTTAVKFREEAGQPDPKGCPCIIDVDKKDCNFVVKNVTTKNGDPAVSNTLWVSKWTKSKEEYRDTSMDDFV